MITDERKQELLEKYCDINVDHRWWDAVFDQTIDAMGAVGITILDRDIQFSGFWSRGDGANFVGYVDVPQFMAAHPQLAQDFSATEWLIHREPDAWSITMERMGAMYQHSGYVSICVDYNDGGPCGGGGSELVQSITDIQRDLSAKEADALNKDVTEIMRGYMDKLYDDLEQAHEYLISDDVVWEAIAANDLDVPDEDEDEDEDGEETPVDLTDRPELQL